jgi:hypothetical protein
MIKWSRVFPESLIVAKLARKLPTFCGTDKLISLFINPVAGPRIELHESSSQSNTCL